MSEARVYNGSTNITKADMTSSNDSIGIATTYTLAQLAAIQYLTIYTPTGYSNYEYVDDISNWSITNSSLASSLMDNLDTAKLSGITLIVPPSTDEITSFDLGFASNTANIDSNIENINILFTGTKIQTSNLSNIFNNSGIPFDAIPDINSDFHINVIFNSDFYDDIDVTAIQSDLDENKACLTFTTASFGSNYNAVGNSFPTTTFTAYFNKNTASNISKTSISKSFAKNPYLFGSTYSWSVSASDLPTITAPSGWSAYTQWTTSSTSTSGGINTMVGGTITSGQTYYAHIYKEYQVNFDALDSDNGAANGLSWSNSYNNQYYRVYDNKSLYDTYSSISIQFPNVSLSSSLNEWSEYYWIPDKFIENEMVEGDLYNYINGIENVSELTLQLISMPIDCNNGESLTIEKANISTWLNAFEETSLNYVPIVYKYQYATFKGNSSCDLTLTFNSSPPYSDESETKIFSKIRYNNDTRTTWSDTVPYTIEGGSWETIGFNTNPLATTALFGVGATATLTAGSTYYVICSTTATAYFEGRGATLNKTSVSSTVYNGNDYFSATLPTITKSGWTAVGFTSIKTVTDTANSGFTSGATVSVTDGTTYYAVYKKTGSVSFDANGATLSSTSASTTLYNGNTTWSVTLPTITKTGWSILGFGSSASATSIISGWTSGATSKTVTDGTTYYAVTRKDITVSYKDGLLGNKDVLKTYSYYNTSTSVSVKLLKFADLSWTVEYYELINWISSSTTYNLDTSYNLSSDITFMAVWNRLQSLLMKVKNNDSWKSSYSGYVKVNGSWKRIVDSYVKVNGSWKKHKQ